MSAPAGRVDVVERAAGLLADGGHVADGDDVRAAWARIYAEVVRQLNLGALGIDTAVDAVERATCDQLATRLLQGRPLGGALHDVAVLHALIGHPYPAAWFEVSALDGIA